MCFGDIKMLVFGGTSGANSVRVVVSLLLLHACMLTDIHEEPDSDCVDTSVSKDWWQNWALQVTVEVGTASWGSPTRAM